MAYNYDTNSEPQNPIEKQAKFNSMQAILFRINELNQKIHLYGSNGRYEKWNILLDRIWVELAADAKEEDETKFNELNKQIAKIGFRINIETEELKNISLLYKAILKKEIFLKKLQNRLGMGVSYEESIEDYM